MRGYFDDEEAEAEDRRRDTELTLGGGALLAIFFGLVLICGLCFGLGYAVGHHASSLAPAAARQPVTQTAAPDQEPLQASGSIPKPSAAAQAPAPPPASDATQSSASPGANPAGTQPSPALAAQSSAPAGATPAQPQVRPAIPATANALQSGQAALNVRPALPATVQLMVQVAAVSRTEDADVLVNALRKRGYSVTARRESADGLIHVRIGPFTSRDDANRMCKKLLDDGYNAIIQP